MLIQHSAQSCECKIQNISFFSWQFNLHEKQNLGIVFNRRKQRLELVTVNINCVKICTDSC